MLKTASLFAALIAIFILQACKKNNDSPVASYSYPKTFSEVISSPSPGISSSVAYSLLYDGNNRLISMSVLTNPDASKYIYNYISGNSFTMDLYYSNVLYIHENYWLNASSMLDSTFQYDRTGDTTTEKYIYNSAKQLAKIKLHNYPHLGAQPDQTTDFTYDSDGNLVQESNTILGTTSFTYYTDLPNNFSFGKPFTPQSKYFIKTTTNTGNNGQITYTHYYSFDDNNRVIKDSAITTEGAGVTDIKTYTY